ncbi:MAG: pentapeptide repeat-containing protein [Planctomycetales bacterium]|nr:pentapeptide repeat-containing protein [Planctomycetales bacterium]
MSLRKKVADLFDPRPGASPLPMNMVRSKAMKLAFGTAAIIITVSYVMIFVASSGLLIHEILQLLVARLQGAKLPSMEFTKELGVLLAAIVGAPFVLWQTASVWRQAVTADERHITERLEHAAEQLWSTRRVPSVRNYEGTWISLEDVHPNIEARVAGLRQLAHISDYSEAYHISTMESICLYLRLNARRDMSTDGAAGDDPVEHEFRPFTPRADIVEAIQILGRRSEQRRNLERAKCFWLNVNRTALRQIDLWNVKLARASLAAVDFTESYLVDADFELAWLNGSVFDRAFMRGCKLSGAAVPGCDFKLAHHLQHDQISSAFGVKSGTLKTILPDGWEPPKHWFSPSKPDLTVSDLFDEFDVQYADFCRRRGLDFVPSR